MSSQPNEDKCTLIRTMGWPKTRKSHGHRVFVVRGTFLGREAVDIRSNLRSYSTGCTPNAVSKLDQLVVRCRTHPDKPVDRDLYDILCDPAILELAYNNIKSNPGNMTPGITPTTLDGTSWETFCQISSSLKDESFQFKPSRRIHIPKASGGKRPLTIAPPRDKIVQEALRLLLNAIFEPTFLNVSHGFRPGKSCHSALKEVFAKFKPSAWVIEGDISKCFDSIDHHKLMSLIEHKILDRKFTRLIWKCLRVGYFEFRQYSHNIAGTPQGTIISPILSNIFLHQLDVFVESLKKDFDIGTRAKNTSEYEKTRHLIKKAKKGGRMSDLLSLYKQSQKLPVMDFRDPSYKRLAYVRYADDWVIGIRGSLKDAELVLSKVTAFCNEIGLDVSDTKTRITNLLTEKVLFLGVNIFRSKQVKMAAKSNYSSSKQRQNQQLRLTVPIDRIRKKLSIANFYKDGKATPRYLWMHLEHEEILHLYNSVFRGFLNYYSFAHNYSQLVSILNLYLRKSCAKLLAAKFSMNSTAKVFAKFGKDLSCHSVKFLTPSYVSNMMNFKVNASPVIPTLFASHISKASLKDLPCSVCGSKYRVEMHHVKHMKTVKPGTSEVDRIMIRANRKQIPLCRECHVKHHTSKV
jgi:group II intron reverse transcriptase/maturase